MTDRRRHRRFLLPHSTAEIRVLQDVIVESIGAEHVTIIASASSAAGEELNLHLSSRSGHARAMTVRPVESTPLVTEQGMRHRLRLAVVHTTMLPGPSGTEVGESWASDMLACVLARRVPARVLDVSALGCLLETSSACVTLGSSALLDLDVDGARYIEMIRVCRAVPGAASVLRCRIGAEFLPTFEGMSRSLRPLVAQLEARQAGLTVARPALAER